MKAIFALLLTLFHAQAADWTEPMRKVHAQFKGTHGTFAQFAFEGGVNASFTSRKQLRHQVAHWGLELIGSKTSARILCDVYPAIRLLKPGAWDASGRTDQWQRFDGDPASVPVAERGFGPANRRLVEDWIEAIAKNREPACSGHHAMKSLEMIMAVYHAALSGARVTFPLKDRTHPLAA